ncbi:methyltransferase [Streptomyces celluloflavus]|uniref:methyltransferase n=1 Tax=Streptomyces celluloflavus TaxID=58344 RepID=UPI0036C3CEB6
MTRIPEPVGDNGVSPIPLMELTSGFWAFKTLAAASELGVFAHLADGREAGVRTIAAELGMADRPARLLLTACTALGLLEKNGEHYRNSAMAEEFLVPGRPYHFGGLVRFCDQREYLPWHRLTESLRTNRPLTWDSEAQDTLFSAAGTTETELLCEGMHSLSAITARVLARSYDFGTYHKVLDVGGGSGAYLIELCKRYEQLRGTVYDLPDMCHLAQGKITAAGLDGTITTAPGDFLHDTALPDGHDLILLCMVLHDWDEQTGRMLLRKCGEALASHGTVMVCELLLNRERTGPAAAALMGMNMLVETMGGQNYTGDQYLLWMREAGFRDTRIVRFAAPGANGVVIGHRP